MQRIEVEVYSQAVNAWVIRTPGREFPALVLQGDTFSTLCFLARSILDRTKACSCADEELEGEAEELHDLLEGYLQSYEKAMVEHGIALPGSPGTLPK